MLNDATCFKKIFIVTGYTDLRSGIDRLADTICSYLGEDAIEADTLYLFCGRRTDRIKGLVWENDVYLLLYKRLEAGQFQWPRTESEVRSITEQQFRWHTDEKKDKEDSPKVLSSAIIKIVLEREGLCYADEIYRRKTEYLFERDTHSVVSHTAGTAIRD